MTVENTSSEINSLISLLDDPDAEIYKQVLARLRKLGKVGIDSLKKELEQNSDNKLRNQRIERLLNEINFNTLVDDLTDWSRKGQYNMPEFLILVAHYEYPNVHSEVIKNEIDRLTEQIRQDMSQYATPLQRVRNINHVLYQVQQFKSNFNNPMDPDNVFINRVLKTKKGSDIVLGILYLHIADNLGLPIYGINFPKNFLLGYVSDESNKNLTSMHVAFYINPYNQGIPLSKDEILSFLKQHKLQAKPEYLKPAEKSKIALRLLKYLMISYKRNAEERKVRDIQKLIEIVNKNTKE
ncbi:MAG: transglutaminase-like domain-containing protein [Bacteroidota bacterium]|nr:transglutaminase-like domain-containing protein [Bacteroidota bacterium]